MVDVREIPTGSTHLALPALLALRRHFDPGSLIEVIDDQLRPQGYRLVGAFDGDSTSAASIAGFRITYALVRGRHLVVDEMATVSSSRGRGYASALVDWLKAEAVRQTCAELHLDSAVGPNREAAHRLYHRHHLRISAHHFHCEL